MSNERQLTVEEILDAGIALADDGGLESVTMRRLANELAVTPMALYWHLPNRAALIDAMAARAIEAASVPALGSDPWPDQLREVLGVVAGVLQEHRWMGAVASSRYVRAESYLQLLEVMIGVVRLAGLEVASAVALLDVGIDSLVAVVAGSAADGCEPDPAVVDCFTALDDYPHLQEAAPYLAAPTPGRTALAIEMVVDAVRAHAR